MEEMSTARIVFVDDEPTVCDVVEKTLERAGLGVQCFQSVDDCLDYLKAERCDLLVTDVKMPQKDGIELLCEVKQQMPWLPVVVVTGYGDVPMAVRALKSGAADFVEKPLDRDALLGTIRTVLVQNVASRALFDLNLTRMEMKTLHLLLEGKNNREIANLLHRSSRTVEVHRCHLMRKMKAANIVELLRRAAEMGLFHREGPGGENAAPSR